MDLPFADLLARLRGLEPPLRPLEHYAELVDAVLAGLGVEPEAEEGEQTITWELQVGQAPITLEIGPNAVLGQPTLEVRSACLRLPPGDLLPFYRRCLELNRVVTGCSLGVENDVLVVAGERELAGLDRRGLARLLLDVASTADQVISELSGEFGAAPLNGC
jgi:hypothetical protein